MKIHHMKIRRIMRWDPTLRKLRMFRVVWQRGEWGMKTPEGRCIPYSFALTVGLRPALFSFRREYDQVRTTLFGVVVNYHRSAGGTLV